MNRVPATDQEHPEGFTQRLLLQPSIRYNAVLILLGLITVWGAYAWSVQLRDGLIVTGMRDQVPWGIYIGNLVFFIGLSYGSALVSAVLRVTQASWRYPITRVAETVGVVALLVGGVQIVFDLGRPERFLNLLVYGRFQSPLIWDVVAVGAYFVACIAFFLLPLIPDLALLRDQPKARVASWQRRLYSFVAVGWSGAAEQRTRLARAMKVMTIVMILLSVALPIVLGWVFAMTLRPGWNSAVFGPTFVTGASFSGIAAVVLATGFVRRAGHLGELITEQHFHRLGYLLITLDLLYVAFTSGEYLSMWYKLEGEEKELLSSLLVGQQAGPFWSFLIGGLFLPALLVALPWTRTAAGIQAASLLALAGMWLKRFLIVVPSLEVPLMPLGVGQYTPTWVEWSILLGSVSGFLLLFGLIIRLIPVVSIWEGGTEAVSADRQRGRPEERVPFRPASAAAPGGE